MDKYIEASKKVFPDGGAWFWYYLLIISVILIIIGIGTMIIGNNVDMTLALVASSFWLAMFVILSAFSAVAAVKIAARVEKWAKKMESAIENEEVEDMEWHGDNPPVLIQNSGKKKNK
jgi:membrane protein implicated in regulation of membrane protease activity